MLKTPWTEQVLAAQSGAEGDDAFDDIFDAIQGCAPDNFKRLDVILRQMQTAEVRSTLHYELLISTLRLTFVFRDSLNEWEPALAAVRTELFDRRLADVDSLLHGLGP